MAPLILHNVPDEERYIGDDGIQRPYAMLFPQDGGVTRSRKAAGETGSFGKSTRRSRSRTGTPIRREDPTLAAADKVFSSWIQDQAKNSAPQNGGGSSKTTTNTEDGTGAPTSQPQQRFTKKQAPCEIILRGYRTSAQQYAAINHYELLAGRICEDYPRDPPAEARRYKSELRDPAYLRRQPLTIEERLRVNRPDGGEHWIKVTFESHEAAERALGASPQSVLGHLVYAEPYHGIPPNRDEAVVDAFVTGGTGGSNEALLDAMFGGNGGGRRPSSPTRQRDRRHRPTNSFSNYDRRSGRSDRFNGTSSQQSSETIDSATITADSSATATSGTVTGSNGGLMDRMPVDAELVPVPAARSDDDEFCRAIPTARKVKLLPADQALLPQPSLSTRMMTKVPFLKWFNGAMIGNEVPRTETGEFDWSRASLYWKLMAWLDKVLGLFQGELLNADKDD